MKSVDKKNNFSVSLGLVDYVNPIIYLLTSFTIIFNMNSFMPVVSRIFYILGVVVSLVFGFSIPTLKLLIGLGKIKFKLPVNFVFYVNSGIFWSGLLLFKNIFNVGSYIFLSVIVFVFSLLFLIYKKTKKFNNVAVLIGAIGYLFIYVSLITKSISHGLMLPVIFYIVAIFLYLMLVGIGMKANLEDARVHWVIEISNILCQASVFLGTLILFSSI